MQTRKFDEMISYFNRKVSDMYIDRKYKIELFAMIAAIGMAHEKELDAQQEQWWIPCSERLPEEDGHYLVWAVMSFVPDHVDEPNTYQGTTIASYFKRLTPFKWFGDHVEQVIAWMPLPKPYMRGKQDE